MFGHSRELQEVIIKNVIPVSKATKVKLLWLALSPDLASPMPMVKCMFASRIS